MQSRYSEKVKEISLGEPICIKLKQIYYPETNWFQCYKDVGKKFTELKKKARLFYSTYKIE
jgi:hypothetical protein